MLALIGGAVVAAFFGAGLSGRLSNEQLERVILVLLVAIGCAFVFNRVRNCRRVLQADNGFFRFLHLRHSA
jgi:uncharacterized membrane protein YfcA